MQSVAIFATLFRCVDLYISHIAFKKQLSQNSLGEFGPGQYEGPHVNWLPPSWDFDRLHYVGLLLLQLVVSIIRDLCLPQLQETLIVPAMWNPNCLRYVGLLLPQLAAFVT